MKYFIYPKNAMDFSFDHMIKSNSPHNFDHPAKDAMNICGFDIIFGQMNLYNVDKIHPKFYN